MYHFFNIVVTHPCVRLALIYEVLDRSCPASVIFCVDLTVSHDVHRYFQSSVPALNLSSSAVTGSWRLSSSRPLAEDSSPRCSRSKEPSELRGGVACDGVVPNPNSPGIAGPPRLASGDTPACEAIQVD